MKIVISEKQLKLLLGHVTETELGEQTEPPPASDAASGGTGGTGYPPVGKWESGVTRGPANQIANTKWEDIVGSTLTRGKANPLK